MGASVPGALAGLRAAGGPMECIATADVSQQFAALKVSLGEGICKTHLPSGAERSGCGGRLMAASAVGSIDTNVEQVKEMQTGCVENVWALLKRKEKDAEKECATNKLERTQAAVRAALKVPELCLDLAWRRVRRRGGRCCARTFCRAAFMERSCPSWRSAANLKGGRGRGEGREGRGGGR